MSLAFQPPVSRMAQWFDGTATFASVPLDLSAVNKLTISFWLWWNAFGAGDNLAMEFTTNLGSNPGSFLIDPNKSSTNNFGVALRSATSGTGGTTQYNRFSNVQQHNHIFFEADMTQTSTSQWVGLFFNGVVQTPTSTTGISSGTNTAGTFSNDTLYIMSRAGTSLFATGALSNLAIWTNRLLNATELALLVRGGDPRVLIPTYFWRMNQLGRVEKNLAPTGPRAQMTTTSMGTIAGPTQLVYPQQPTTLVGTAASPAVPASIPSAPQIWSPLTLGAAAWKMGKLIEENRPLTRRGLLLPRRRIVGSGE